MHVRSLMVRDFRSYAVAELGLSPGVTILLGRNGAGKTNLVEALGYVATLGSHRVAADHPLVRSGAGSAVVRAEVVEHGRSVRVEIEIVPGRSNRARINGSPATRPKDVLGILRTVLFAPEDLALVKGDPSERRRFLDEVLVARAPRWAGVRADYDRTLKQRNALLKSVATVPRSARANLPTLDVWDASLAALGAQLVAARVALVEALQPYADKSYATMTAALGGSDPVLSLHYRSSALEGTAGNGTRGDGGAPVETPADVAAWERVLLESLQRSRPAEIERGISLVGPHRDELHLALGAGGLPAKGYASHGESWSVALALRLASYELLRSDGQGEPVLVLDDVLAELDTGRRERLGDLLAGAEQVLITAADPQDVPGQLQGRSISVPADVMADGEGSPTPAPAADE